MFPATSTLLNDPIIIAPLMLQWYSIEMKKLLGIVVLGLLLSGSAYAGFFSDFFSNFGSGYKMSGCTYDHFGKKDECITVSYGKGTGKTWEQASDECYRILDRKRRAKGYPKDGTHIGGCV
jgi:hypothetical protein